jgi:hypothetical protein
MKEQYLLPPVLTDSVGQIRKAGFEFEFGNLPILQTAQALQQALGGELDTKSPFEAVLHGSILGKLKVERDADILKSVKYRKWLEQLGVEFSPGSVAHGIEANIDNASRILIPCEVVTEPIPFDKLDKLDTLIATLNSLGAEGTQDSLIYAFGLHINPSLPASDATTIRKYIQAFLLLHSWIIESSGIDITRRFLTKYIDPFPQPYMELMLSGTYAPGMKTLINDYLEHNPTRNRALDMLPILCEIDEPRVLNAVNDDERNLIKGRPAFHYRLPDCKVNVPGWSTAAPWNQWVYIEKLAGDEALLMDLIGEWRETNDKFSIAPRTNWTMRLTSLLSQKYFSR